MTRYSGCGAPYFELDLTQSSGLAACCCYYKGELARWKPGMSLDECWNGDAMQGVRSYLRGEGGNAVRSCPGCHWYRYRDPATHPYPPFLLNLPDDLNDVQRQNWQKALEEYQARSIVVESVPVRHYFNFGMPCNIQCPMCTQTGQRKKELLTEPGLRVDADTVLDWGPQMAAAAYVDVIGGDPFAIPEARKFMKRFAADERFDDVWLGILTNAYRLEGFLDHLKRKTKVRVTVSLDSIGETYNYVRQGSDWDRVSSNIDAFLERGRKDNLRWEVYSSNIVMKSCIPTLPDLCRWLVDRNIPITFTHLVKNDTNETFVDSEDVFANPHLLEETPGWRNAFDAAVAILTSHGGNPGAVNSLETMKRSLEDQLAADSS